MNDWYLYEYDDADDTDDHGGRYTVFIYNVYI